MEMRLTVSTILGICFLIWIWNPDVTKAEIIERPTEIAISVIIGKDSFQRTFEITAKADITDLSVSATELQTKAGDASIGSRNIEIQPAMVTSLKKDSSESITLTIKNPTRPGEYKGEIRIRYVEHSSKKESFPIVVNVNGKPRLSLITPSKIVIKTTGTSGDISRHFTMREADGQGGVENITIIQQDLITEDQATTISRDLLQPTLATEIPKGSYATGTLTLKSLKGVQSGRYGGRVIVHSSNTDDVEIPLEVSVKHSWCLPSVVLVVGILMGFLFNWWDTKGKKQAELADRLREVHQALVNDKTLSQIFGKNIQGFIDAANGKLRNNLDGAEKDVKTAEQKLDEWHYNGAEYVKRINEIKTTILKEIDQSDQEEFQDLDYVKSIRRELVEILESIADYASLAALDEAVKKWKVQLNKLDNLCKDIKNLKNDLAESLSQNKIKSEEAGEIESQIDEAHKHLRDVRSEEDLPKVRQDVELAQKKYENLVYKQSLKGMPGLLVQPPTVTPFVIPELPKVIENSNIRHLKWIIQSLLVIIAAFVGLVTIYGTNDTFGASKSYSDYLGLFGWGLGVELTRSKLSEIIKSAK